jgi:tetratricopeptide (TPR) repeat protein
MLFSSSPGAAMVAVGALAAEAPGTFEQANKLYEQGRYADAATAYESLLKSHTVSAPLLFNLGNAYFKAGQLGRAIAAYRLAQQLAPRDPDITANLRFARDSVNAARGSGSRWRAWLNRITVNELTWIWVAVLWVFFLLLAAGQWKPEWKTSLRTFLITAAVAVVFSGALLLFFVAEQWQSQPAVVVRREAVVRRGPYEISESIFTLPDGVEVTVVDRKTDWLRILDSSGRSGWVRADQLILLTSPKNLIPNA